MWQFLRDNCSRLCPAEGAPAVRIADMKEGRANTFGADLLIDNLDATSHIRITVYCLNITFLVPY